MTASRLLDRTFQHFRSRRMSLFEKTFQISTSTRVLDVGGSPEIWRFASVQPKLTLLNLPSALVSSRVSADQVAGDGRLLPFADKAFDIVFSNSVIEHVGNAADQQHFASELARVGRCYWVQTPNRRFPLEMHLMLPLVHYLPKAFQGPIVNRFTIWEMLVKPDASARAAYLKHFLNELRLLDANALRSLFPDAHIIEERTFGLSKSLIAVRA